MTGASGDATPACRSCGAPALEAAPFCGQCGTRLGPTPAGAPGAPPAEADPDPMIGRLIRDTYVVEERIGSGGMGEVYRARHRKLDAPVAMKLIRRELLADPAMVHRFEREARAASRLRHPNVVLVTDFGQTDDGLLFMIMECLGGRSLARVVAEEAPLPEARVADIGGQILAALAEAHAHGVLHRDLKPENVIVESRRDAPDAVKVLDFGIAKLLAGGAPRSTLTRAGLVCGTPGYMSPEQLRNDELDPRSDLFAAGMVLYEMLTRRLPFDAHTPWELLHLHLSEPVPPPGLRRGQPVSPALEDLVLRAVAARREDRPPSAQAMRAELLGLFLPAARTPPPRPTPGATEVLPPDAVPPSPPDAAPPTPHDPALLARVEARLAAVVGPVAAHLVRRAAREHAGPAALCDRLATFIPGQAEREAFLAWSRGALTPGAAPTPVPPAPSPAAAWDPSTLEEAQRDLAEYLGPVARVVVRRASARARDPQELYELLAAEIPGEADRAAFRRRARPLAPGAPPGAG